jgi:hypothetical protein
MRRVLFSVTSLLALASSLALSGCGSSSATSPTPTATPTPTIQPAAAAGGDFCTQVQHFATQFLQVERGLINVTPGATPNVATTKQLIAAIASLIDGLDSSAPGGIATDVHTLRTAFDQANTQVQAATSLQQLSTAFAPLSAPAVTSADHAVTAYLTATCHITPAATP